eukprot:g76885.t1
MAEQLEQELSEDKLNDSRSSKKQRVSDDANEEDEENQQSLLHLSQEVERITKTIEAKAVEKMSHKSVQELVDKYSQEIVKSVDTLIRPSLLETVKQSVEKTIENALAKTVNEAVEEALKRFNDKEMEAKKESLIAEAVIKKMEERMTVAELEPYWSGIICRTAINQMNVKGCEGKSENQCQLELIKTKIKLVTWESVIEKSSRSAIGIHLKV